MGGTLASSPHYLPSLCSLCLYSSDSSLFCFNFCTWLSTWNLSIKTTKPTLRNSSHPSQCALLPAIPLLDMAPPASASQKLIIHLDSSFSHQPNMASTLFLLNYIWHITLSKLRCTTCSFDTFMYCNVIAIVALANTSVMWYNYNFFLWWE